MHVYNSLIVYGDSVIFTPPLFSDAGSYWCRNRTNHSDMTEGKLLFKGACQHALCTILKVHNIPFVW